MKAARRAKRRALGGEAQPQASLSARRFKTTESSPSARFSWLTNPHSPPCARGRALFSKRRTEVCCYPRGAEPIVEYRLNYGATILDVVVDGEREVLYSHSVVPEADGVHACVGGEVVKSLVDAVHEMVENPCSAACVEILRGD